jgi:nucleoid-associated protein YgaU
MTRLALIGTIGLVIISAILGLIYAISQQDVDEPAEPPAAAEPASTDEPAANAQTGAAQTAAAPASTEQPAAQAPQSDANAAPAPEVAPNPAAQTQVAAAAKIITPSFDVVRVNPNGDAVVAGRAQPGATITLMDGDKAIGTADADDRGEWVLLPDSAIAPGEHRFSVRAKADNGPVVDSDKLVIVVVPKPAENIAGQPVTKPSGALAIEVPKTGEGATRLLNAPEGGKGEDAATAKTDLALDAIDYTPDGHDVLSGRTRAGGDLILYLDNQPIGSAKAGADGLWAFTAKDAVPPGDHELRIDLVGEGARVEARLKTPFAQPDFADLKLNGRNIVVQPGNSLWRIARRSYGDGVMYTVIFEANKDRIADPDLIYPGQVFSLPPGAN